VISSSAHVLTIRPKHPDLRELVTLRGVAEERRSWPTQAKQKKASNLLAPREPVTEGARDDLEEGNARHPRIEAPMPARASFARTSRPMLPATAQQCVVMGSFLFPAGRIADCPRYRKVRRDLRRLARKRSTDGMALRALA
jgi:hypothetical protein